MRSGVPGAPSRCLLAVDESEGICAGGAGSMSGNSRTVMCVIPSYHGMHKIQAKRQYQRTGKWYCTVPLRKGDRAISCPVP